jgi:cellulose synthase/poly-beta-1,6-N-acetylglucosamine synthase-like glycosyltransferase
LRVGVATTFVPDAESTEMLETTVRALVAMDYPHETWVLDEGDDSRVKRLCEELGAFHFSRKGRPEYQAEEGAFKARTKFGNLNSWLDAIGYDRYDYVCAFDPDHVPRPRFLNRTLGYFQDATVAYVQAAQVYYNQDASFIARGAAEETYAYYSCLQMASYGSGFPIITGCHNTHRMAALKKVGGFPHHDADDLLLTLHYLIHDWRGVYVPEVLAVGLTPVDWSGYLRQQLRWARSVLDIKFHILPRIAARLPFRARVMSILHGLNYIAESALAPASLLFLAYLLVSQDIPVISRIFGPAGQILILLCLVQALYRQRFFLLFDKEWGLHWRADLLRYAKWPQILQALVEAIVRRRVPYTITRKSGLAPPGSGVVWPNAVVAGLLGAAWIIGWLLGVRLDTGTYIALAVILSATVGLIATRWLRYPEPFDQRLVKRIPAWWPDMLQGGPRRVAPAANPRRRARAG